MGRIRFVLVLILLGPFALFAFPAQATSYEIGDTGPAGGIIVAVPLTSGNTSGMYFEAAPQSLPTKYRWCTSEAYASTAIAPQYDMGEGKNNTQLIISRCGTNTAAWAAEAYSLGGYSDWFLPSANELSALRVTNDLFTVSMVPHRPSILNASLGLTASSTDNAGTIPWVTDLYDGYSGVETEYVVHPIRSFAAAPQRPTIGDATLVSATSANITFTGPTILGGSPLQSFTVVADPGGDTATVTNAAASSIVINNLLPNTNYTFSVYATNAIGDSTLSDSSNQITTGKRFIINATGSIGDGTSCSSPHGVGLASIPNLMNQVASLSEKWIEFAFCSGTYLVSSPIVVENMDTYSTPNDISVESVSGDRRTFSFTSLNGDRNSVVLDGQHSSSIFRIDTRANVKIDSLTLQNGFNSTQSGGAVNVIYSPDRVDGDGNLVLGNHADAFTNTTISNNRFLANRSGIGGGAVEISGDDMGAGDLLRKFTLINNDFYENSAQVDGGALAIDAVSFDPTKEIVSNNHFAYNFTNNRSGGAISSNFNSATFTSNYFLNNHAPSHSGQAIYTNGINRFSGNRIIDTLTQPEDEEECFFNGSDTFDNDWASNSNCFPASNPTLRWTTKSVSDLLASSGLFLPQSPELASGISPTAPGLTRVEVTLSADRYNGGSVLTNYSYSLNGQPFVDLAPAQSGTLLSISGLTPSTTYSLRLKSQNVAGLSISSSPINFTTLSPTVPGAPTITSVSVNGTTSASVIFAAPTSNGGAEINSYIATIFPSEETRTATSAGSITFTGLTPATQYRFKVKARNSVGNSSDSIFSDYVTTDSLPTPPPPAPRVEKIAPTPPVSTVITKIARAVVLKEIARRYMTKLIELRANHQSALTKIRKLPVKQRIAELRALRKLEDSLRLKYLTERNDELRNLNSF